MTTASPTKAPCILGFDPGTEFGLTVLTGVKIEICAHAKLRCDGMARLSELFDFLVPYIDRYQPSLFVTEGYSFNSRGGAGTYTTAEMGGIVRLVVTALRVPFLVVPPLSLLKFITGSGSHAGDKSSTPLAVYKRWSVDCQSSHAAESYGLARLGLCIRDPQFTRDLIAPQKQVVEKIRAEVIEKPHEEGVPARRRGTYPDRLRTALIRSGCRP